MNGPRVMGVLAMTRAIGDMCFRRYGVICDPEVSSILRDDQDEFFIMATDGLWDVVANEEAYLITRQFISYLIIKNNLKIKFKLLFKKESVEGSEKNEKDRITGRRRQPISSQQIDGIGI